MAQDVDKHLHAGFQITVSEDPLTIQNFEMLFKPTLVLLHNPLFQHYAIMAVMILLQKIPVQSISVKLMSLPLNPFEAPKMYAST